MAYPSIRSFRNTAGSNSSATSHSLLPPTSIVDGDLLVAVCGFKNNFTSFTDNSGLWTTFQTQFTGNTRYGIYYKIANSESGNYSFTSSHGGRVAATIFAIRDFNASTPLAHFAQGTVNTSATNVFPQVTPANNANMIIACSFKAWGNVGLIGWPWPAGTAPVCSWISSVLPGDFNNASWLHIGVYGWGNTQTPAMSVQSTITQNGCGAVFAVQSNDGTASTNTSRNSQTAVLVLGAEGSPSRVLQMSVLSLIRTAPVVFFTEIDTGLGK